MGARKLNFLTTRARDEEQIIAHITASLRDKIIHSFRSQAECARKWKVPLSTVNEIVNERYDRLTLRQIIDFALKSGAHIEIGLYYKQ